MSIVAEPIKEASTKAFTKEEMNELAQLLKEEGLHRYVKSLVDGGVGSVEALKALSPREFSNFGITMPAHCKMLTGLIASLQKKPASDVVVPANSQLFAEEDLFQEPSAPAYSANPARSTVAVSRVPEPSLFGDGPSSAPRSSAPRTLSSSSSPVPSSSVSIEDAVAQVRNDQSDSDWVIFSFNPKTAQPEFEVSGSGGYDEFLDNISDSKVQYGFVRLITGDRESRRVKFVFVCWVGPSVSTIIKARSNTLKSDLSRRVGQFHVEIFAEEFGDLSLDRILQKLKSAAGADYDQGNKEGYESQVGSIKARALSNYQVREKEGNLKSVVFEKHALPSTTPCDISNRPMVAPSSEARKNLKGAN